MQERQRLEFVVFRESVAVDAHLAPRDAARDIEVGRGVEALLGAFGEKVVELLHRHGVEGAVALPAFRGIPVAAPAANAAVVVVEADRVVAERGEAVREAVGGRVFQNVQVHADVDAVEPHRDARTPLELEMLADGAKPAALSRRGIQKSGKIEGASRHDVSRE